MRGAYARHERLVLGLAVSGLFLLFWEGLARGWWGAALHVRPLFLSSPTAIVALAYRMYFVTGEIWPNLAASGLELVAGLLAAIMIGVPLGLVAGRNRLLGYAFEPFLAAFNATPQVAFLPLIVLWIGMGLTTRILVIFLLAVLPILMNAQAAVRTTDPRLLRVARSFSASERWTVRSIVLPSAIPFILAGLRLAIGRAMIGIVVGELYGSARGIGIMINQAGGTFETTKVFVGVATIVVFGLLLTDLVRRVEARTGAWRAPVEQQTT